MEQLTCNWNPQLIVELIKAIAWPLTVLIVGIKFRSGIFESVRNFFSKNRVTELSATTSSVSAKFTAEKQSSEVRESAGTSAVSLPDNMSLDAIRKRHEQSSTEFSEEIYKAIKTHLTALKLPQAEEIEILTKETSLLQSAIRYFDINKVIFRSQFNLFSIMFSNGGYISKADVQNHFANIKKLVGNVFSEWDWIKYISYPVSSGLIGDEGEGYKLTTLGGSYVSFMSRNPQLIDELAKL